MSSLINKLGLLLAVLLFASAPVVGQRNNPDLPPVKEPDLKKPPTEAAVKAAVELGVKRLVAMQEAYDPATDPRARRRGRRDRPDAKGGAAKGGKRDSKLVAEWPYEGVYRIGSPQGVIIPPGYRVGGTSIAAWSLLEAPGFAKVKDRQEAFKRGFSFVVDYMEREPLMESGFKGGYDVRGWGHTYALQLCLIALDKKVLDQKDTRRARRVVKWCIKTLVDTEIPTTGGWNYARRGGGGRSSPASPFMTGPTILALMEAKSQGFKVDEDVVKRALQSLEDGRLETGAFQYSTNPGRKNGRRTEAPAGSAARSAVAEAALHLAGRGSVDRVRRSIEIFFKHWKWLEQRRAKNGTHIGDYGIAPYYFYFGHQYVGLAIELLPKQERDKYRDLLRQHYWVTRSDDGTWNDRVFPRSAAYGTSTTILGLMAPRMALPEPWKL